MFRVTIKFLPQSILEIYVKFKDATVENLDLIEYLNKNWTLRII